MVTTEGQTIQLESLGVMCQFIYNIPIVVSTITNSWGPFKKPIEHQLVFLSLLEDQTQDLI